MSVKRTDIFNSHGFKNRWRDNHSFKTVFHLSQFQKHLPGKLVFGHGLTKFRGGTEIEAGIS